MLCAPVANFFFTQRGAPPFHNALSSSDEFVEGVQFPRFVPAPSESRDLLGLKSASEDVAAGSDDGSRVEHGVDAAFAVVAHQHATKLQSAIDVGGCRFVPETHITVIALEIAGIGVGAEVAPFANDGISQESVVAFVAVPEECTIRDFTANAAIRTNGCWTVNACAHFDDRCLTDSEWTANVRSFLNFHVGSNEDWP